MILDKGICSVFRKTNVAEAGKKPVFGYELIGKSWYGQLDFSTSPNWETGKREETNIARRIRILQNTAIDNHDAVILGDTDTVTDGAAVYEVIRAYHGTEDGTGIPITDLTLEAIQP